MTDAAGADPGFIRISSLHSVSITISRLESLLQERGIVVFARIDFGGDATRAGLAMRPEQLLIFGNPKSGTPLMAAEPTVGLDLPLKTLVWEDVNGKTWIAYNDPLYIVRRHGLAPSLGANLAAVVPIIERAARSETQ